MVVMSLNNKLKDNIDIYSLDNRIRVVFEQNKHLNSVTVGVWIGVGSRDENCDNNGIAHMIEHMLFKGTKTMSAKQLAVRCAIIGGSLNAYTSKENTEFYCKTLPSCLKEGIDILGDMICNPKLDPEDLEREKGVVCEEIDMYKDSPEDGVHEILQKKIWKKQPLGYLISGKKKNVKAFSVDELRTFMDKYYVGENMVVSVAGNFNKKETLNWIKKAFEKVPTKNEVFVSDRTTPSYEKASFVKSKDIEQLHMNLAFEAPSFLDEDRYTAVILNNILGSDVNSRLFQTVRENNGLTYSVCSYPSSFSDTGLLHIYAAMNEHQYGRVEELISNILRDLNEKGITSTELSNAKKQTVVEMSLNRDSTASRMSANAKNVIYNIPWELFEDKIDRINKVTKSDVNKLIKKYLQMDKMSMGIIGPVNLKI